MTKGNDASALIFILQYFLLNLFTPNLEEEVDWILELVAVLTSVFLGIPLNSEHSFIVSRRLYVHDEQ